MGLNGLWIFFFLVRTIFLGTEILRPIKFSKNNNKKKQNKTLGIDLMTERVNCFGRR